MKSHNILLFAGYLVIHFDNETLRECLYLILDRIVVLAKNSSFSDKDCFCIHENDTKNTTTTLTNLDERQICQLHIKSQIRVLCILPASDTLLYEYDDI